ncbi:hypothetical protein B0H14DRAFT_3536694 [Mycena olivaceomarginata]|nr:hypothetical protein B0H14DRAFT_3536694 [Mycena olivaceomarginata]
MVKHSLTGDPVYFSKQNWTFPLYFITTGAIAFLVQNFLAFRYWRFTRHTLVVIPLFMLILTALGAALAVTLVTLLFPDVKNHVGIAGVLVYEFQKARSKFMEGRRRMISNRLVVLTIRTGSATAVLAIAAFIMYLVNTETNISVGIMYLESRVYVLSMLMNLNIRTSGNKGSTQGTSVTATSGQDRGTIVFAHGAGTSHTDGLGGVWLSTSHVQFESQQDSTETFKSTTRCNVFVQSHTSEDPPAEIKMTATESSKKESNLLVV